MARVIIKAKILFCNQYSVIKLILIFWRYASGRVTKQENYNDLCGLRPCFRPFYPLSGTAFQQVYAGNAGLCAVSNPQAGSQRFASQTRRQPGIPAADDQIPHAQHRLGNRCRGNQLSGGGAVQRRLYRLVSGADLDAAAVDRNR